MDGVSFWFWVALAIGAYAFVPVFRREVNGWIVKLADKVKHDTLATPAEPETHLVEDVAFAMFERDNPGDARISQGWMALPVEVRGQYVKKALESLIPEDQRTAP